MQNLLNSVKVLQEAAIKAEKAVPAPGSTPSPHGQSLGLGGKETIHAFEVKLSFSLDPICEQFKPRPPPGLPE